MMRIEDTTPGTDCNAIRVSLQPVGDAPLPACEMYGGIPTIDFRGEGYHGHVSIHLGNVTAPADYLRALSRQLAAFAHEVDAATGERMPEAQRGAL